MALLARYGSATAPKLSRKTATPSSLVERWTKPAVISSLLKEEAYQQEQNLKFAPLWALFSDSSQLEAFLTWTLGGNEGDLKLKMDFARRKCCCQNSTLQELVPLLCAEIMDDQLLLQNRGEGLLDLYRCLGDSACELDELPPASDREATPSRRQLVQTLTKLKQDIELANVASNGSPGGSLDYLLHAHRRIGPAAVVILEAQLQRSGSCDYLPPDSALVFRRLRRQFLQRFFAFLLSFYLSQRDTERPTAHRQTSPDRLMEQQ